MGRADVQEDGSEPATGRLDPILVEDAKKRVQAGESAGHEVLSC